MKLIGSWAENNCSLETRTPKLVDAGSCKRRTEEDFSERREQKPPRTNGRKKTMEPICSTPFSLSLPFSLFLPLLLNPTTKPLLLVSDFYLVAPGSRFISRSPFSFSLDSFFPPFLLPSSSSSLSLSPTNSPQPRTVRNFLFRISDP